MKKIECWPPPEWTEVVITWNDILHYRPTFFHGRIRSILDWVDRMPGSRYHLHGYNSTEGFAFRFEDPKDATYFKLKWL